MTFKRLHALIEMHRRTRARELYDLGATMSLAYHEPKRLKELIKPPLDMSKLPNMLRIPKKKAS